MTKERFDNDKYRAIKSAAEKAPKTITLVYEPVYHVEQSAFRDDSLDDISDCFTDYDSEYARNIKERVEKDMEEMGPTGLAQYIWEDDKIYGKVTSIVLRFDEKLEKLFVDCTLAEGVNPYSVLEPLKDYMTGQLADGWGEGFEQQPMETKELYAVYNEDDEYDVSVFMDSRSASYDCDQKNKEERERYDDEDDWEDEDEISEYIWIDFDATLYCSFWSSRHDTLDNVYIDGRDAEGYDNEGYDAEGYNRRGRNKEGYDREGYNSRGYDKEGYDKEGFNNEGLDRKGFNREGYKDYKGKRPTDRNGKEQGGKFRVGKDGKVSVGNIFDEG